MRALIRKKKECFIFGDLRVQCCVGDLLDPNSLFMAMDDVDIVFNASGALPHHRLIDSDYWKINVDGVENLMQAALRRHVKKVVHLSTVGIYGEQVDNVDEKTLPNPKGAYAESKLAGETVVSGYQSDKMSTIIIRPTIAYGPGDTRPVILSLSKLIKRGVFIPIGNGKNYFHTVFIANLVDAIVMSATRKVAEGESFIVGDDPCPTIGQLWNIMTKIAEKTPPKIYIPKPIAYTFSKPFPVIARKVKFLTTNKRYKIDKAKRILGYKPQVDLTEGMAITLDWYKSRSLL